MLDAHKQKYWEGQNVWCPKPGDRGYIFPESGGKVLVEVIEAVKGAVPRFVFGRFLDVEGIISYRVRRVDTGEFGTIGVDSQWMPEGWGSGEPARI